MNADVYKNLTDRLNRLLIKRHKELLEYSMSSTNGIQIQLRCLDSTDTKRLIELMGKLAGNLKKVEIEVEKLKGEIRKLTS